MRMAARDGDENGLRQAHPVLSQAGFTEGAALNQ